MDTSSLRAFARNYIMESDDEIKAIKEKLVQSLKKACNELNDCYDKIIKIDDSFKPSQKEEKNETEESTEDKDND